MKLISDLLIYHLLTSRLINHPSGEMPLSKGLCPRLVAAGVALLTLIRAHVCFLSSSALMIQGF